MKLQLQLTYKMSDKFYKMRKEFNLLGLSFLKSQVVTRFSNCREQHRAKRKEKRDARVS